VSDEHPENVVTAESDDQGLTIVRIFEASREKVFKAWTEPKAFAQWFGEHGSDVPADAATLDVRPGGAWRVVMLVGADTELVFWGHYREVDEPSHLVLTLTDQEFVADQVFDELTVDLEDLGDGRTRMTFTQLGGNMPAAQYERALAGWLLFFERQQDLLKTRHDGA